MRNYLKEIFVNGRYYDFQEELFEGLLARAMREVEVNLIEPNLWAKAKSMSEYDDNKSKANYIKLRAEKMWDFNCSYDIWKTYKAAFIGEDTITPSKKYYVDVGDWIGKVSIKNGQPIGSGYLVDIHGKKSVTKRNIEDFRTILNTHPYRLPAI